MYYPRTPLCSIHYKNVLPYIYLSYSHASFRICRGTPVVLAFCVISCFLSVLTYTYLVSQKFEVLFTYDSLTVWVGSLSCTHVGAYTIAP